MTAHDSRVLWLARPRSSGVDLAVARDLRIALGLSSRKCPLENGKVMPMRRMYWIPSLLLTAGAACSIVGCFGEMGAYYTPEAGADTAPSPDVTAPPTSDTGTKPPAREAGGDAMEGGPKDATSPDATDLCSLPATNQTLINDGKTVFFSAGGVGCSQCHGSNAAGLSGQGNSLLGHTVAQITTCLETQKLMSFLKYPTGVTPGDVCALAAYLQWLSTQPH